MINITVYMRELPAISETIEDSFSVVSFKDDFVVINTVDERTLLINKDLISFIETKKIKENN